VSAHFMHRDSQLLRYVVRELCLHTSCIETASFFAVPLDTITLLSNCMLCYIQLDDLCCIARNAPSCERLGSDFLQNLF